MNPCWDYKILETVILSHHCHHCHLGKDELVIVIRVIMQNCQSSDDYPLANKHSCWMFLAVILALQFFWTYFSTPYVEICCLTSSISSCLPLKPLESYPRCSMSGIFTYICPKTMVPFFWEIYLSYMEHLDILISEFFRAAQKPRLVASLLHFLAKSLRPGSRFND